MLNKQGFITVEAIFYIVISLILTLLLSTIVLRNVYYRNNDRIKVYQSLDLIRKSIQKYPNITKFNKKELEFVDHVKLRINNKELYETPGYMPYLQNVSNAIFKAKDDYVMLSFTYKKRKYNQIIFYVK